MYVADWIVVVVVVVGFNSVFYCRWMIFAMLLIGKFFSVDKPTSLYMKFIKTFISCGPVETWRNTSS